MAKRTTSTHPKTLPMDAKTALAELGLSKAGPSPDPAVAAYHRLRAVTTARPYSPSKVRSAENVLIATRASSPAGIGAKLIELAAHQGWFAKPDHYQTRLIHSAIADLKGLGGRS